MPIRRLHITFIADMAYMLVQFDDEGVLLAVIHNNWLTPRKKEVYWPQYKNQSQYNKAVIRGEAANPENWQRYNIKRVFKAFGMYIKLSVHVHR